MDWLEDEVEKIAAERQDVELNLAQLDRGREELLRKTGLDNIQNEVKKFLKGFDSFSGTEKRNMAVHT